MMKTLSSQLNKLSWQSKLVLCSSTAIFLTFFLFSFLEYHTVSKWMKNREEIAINRTMTDIVTFYNEKGDNLTRKDIQQSQEFLRNMNNRDQLIRVYDQKGTVLVADKSGDFSVLEPTPINRTSSEVISIEGNEAVVAKHPLKGADFTGTLEIVHQLNNYHRMMNNLFLVMTVFGLAAILFSAACGFLLARQLLQPVRDLTSAMKRIKKNGFQERMRIYKQKDELTDLTNVFNEMMDDIEKSFLLQKQFVEDASHEFRTPVSILEGHLSLLKRWGKKDPVILEESLEAALQEVSRLKKLINDLLHLTRAEHPRMKNDEVSDVASILQQLVKNLEIIHPDFHFRINLIVPLPKMAIAKQHFEQIMIILLDNSIQYSSAKKQVQISVKQVEQEVIVEVIDTGIGIPSEHLTKIFNRFYRIDKARSRENGGTGLGLSIAQRLVEKYNGTITIKSREGAGTKVTVAFPITMGM